MGRGIYLSILLLLAISCSISKQGGEVYLKDIHVDRLNRVYSLYSDNTLKISNYKDLPEYDYANNRNGKLTSIDVSNPLKVLVFFKDFSILKVLDNTLSEVASLSFTQLQYEDVRVAAGSNDNNIWIYDAANYQLLKIDETGKELLSSINLTELGLNDLDPVDMLEANNMVFIVDPNIGIVIFDNFGQYIQLLPIEGLSEIFIDRNVILYQEGKQIKGYNRKLIEDVYIDLPEGIDTTYIKIIPTPTQFVMMYRDRVEVSAR